MWHAIQCFICHRQNHRRCVLCLFRVKYIFHPHLFYIPYLYIPYFYVPYFYVPYLHVPYLHTPITYSIHYCSSTDQHHV